LLIVFSPTLFKTPFAEISYLYYAQLELSKTNAVAVTGPLNVGSQFANPETESVRWLRTNQIGDTTAVIVNASGKLELLNNDDAIGSLSGAGKVLLGTATLTTGGDNTSTSYGGFIAGVGGKLTKTGAGTFTLTTNNSYTGATTVNGGVLLVHGQQPQSAVSLLTGGTIGGNGRVGSISALNGHVAPGASPGKLSSGNLSFFSPSSLLKIEINGTNAGVSFDQVDVNGSVLLMGGGLALSMNIVGFVSNQYILVKNDGVDPVSGTFTGLAEGASVTNNGVVFSITYHGGDGNDVVLIQQTLGTSSQFGNIRRDSGGRINLSGAGIPGVTYTVEATQNLNPPAQWQEIGTALASGSGQLMFTDGNAPNYPIRFYRFRLP
jgi:autotransporter-associated beta strand protein